MKKLIFLVSFISFFNIPITFSMEEREFKKRRIDSENITNLSDHNHHDLESDQIFDAMSLSSEIDSIASPEDLKELLLKIGKIEESNAQKIADLLSQKYRHVLFKIFFNTYFIKNTNSGIFSLSMSKNGKMILFGGENVLNTSHSNSIQLALICFDDLNSLLSNDDLIIPPLKIYLKEDNLSFLTAISPDTTFALNSNESCHINLWRLSGLNDVTDINGLTALESLNESFNTLGTLRSIKKINLSNLGGKSREFRGETAVISTDNRYALIADGTCGEDDPIIVFVDLENQTKKVFNFKNDITAITLIPSKSCALAGDTNGSIILINFEDPENIVINSSKLSINSISAIDISVSGKYALISSFGKDLLLYNLNNLENKSDDYIQLQSSDKTAISLCCSPDEKQALIVFINGKISLINFKEKEFKMKLLNNRESLVLDESTDNRHSIRSKFSSNGSYALIAYANKYGLNLACLGNLEPLSLEQVGLIAALNSLKNKINGDSFNLIIKEMLEDQETQAILKKFPKREQDLLEKYLKINKKNELKK